MNKKYAGLPMWAWGVIGVAVIFLWYRHQAKPAANPSSVLDPNAIDPATGLTYGQEESAALNVGAGSVPGASGSTGSVGTGTGTTTTSTGTVDAGSQGIDQFDQGLQSFLQAQSDLQAAAGQLGFQNNPPPTQPTSPPPATPYVPTPNTSYTTMLKIPTPKATSFEDPKTFANAFMAKYAYPGQPNASWNAFWNSAFNAQWAFNKAHTAAANATVNKNPKANNPPKKVKTK